MNKDNQLISERYKTILLKENAQEFDFTKEDDDKIGELEYKDPQKYDEIKDELFKKYFISLDDSEWEDLKNTIKQNSLNTLYYISQKNNELYRLKIKDIENKVKKEIEKGIEDGSLDTKFANELESALYHAVDMSSNYSDDKHPDYYRSTYDNMFETGALLYDKNIKNWYKKILNMA